MEFQPLNLNAQQFKESSQAALVHKYRHGQTRGLSLSCHLPGNAYLQICAPMPFNFAGHCSAAYLNPANTNKTLTTSTSAHE
jgi:hypothetical protein